MARSKFLTFMLGFALFAVGLAFLFLYSDSLVMAEAAPLAPTAADLQISVSAAPDPVTVGDPLTYTISVRNLGPSVAFSVTIQDRLPTGLNFNGVSTIQTLGGAGRNLLLTTTALTGSVSALQLGGIITITGRALVGVATTGSTVVNLVQVSGVNDDNPANNSATTTTTVLPLPATATASVTPTLPPTPTGTRTPQPPRVELRMTKRTTPDTIRPGQLLTYTILVRNIGLLAAQNLVLTDTLPAGVNFDGWTHIAVDRGITPTLLLTGTTLTGRVPQLNPGGLITITSQTLVGLNITGTSLINTAWLAVGKDQAISRYSANVSTPLLVTPPLTPTPNFDPLRYKIYSPVIRR